MTLPRRIAAALVLAGAGFVLSSPGAAAHALLQSSDPPEGAELSAAPDAVTLTFTEAPEIALSSARVFDPSGASYEQGRPQAVSGQPRTIRVRVRSLPEGVYTVAWRVVSRVDGHATGGAFAFGVGVSPVGSPPPPTPAPETPPISGTEIAGRWLFSAGMLGLIGGAWVTALAFRALPAGTRRLMTATWAAGLGGLVLIALAQRSASGVGLGDLLSTPIGRALLWRSAAIVGAGAALVAGSRLKGEGARRALAFSGIVAACGVLAHVAAGHAAAVDPVWRNVASQFVHVLAAGVWIGGLAAVLPGIREAAPEDRARVVRRFSAAAGVALAVVAITGTVRAIGEVGSWNALTSTTYGRLVIAKVVLIVGLAVLGGMNRYRNVPRVSKDVTGLRRVSRGELALAALAILAAAGLASSSPPRGASAGASAPADRIVVIGSDFAETVRVRLEVTPGFAGPNTFVVRATAPDSGDPTDATRVALRFRFADAGVGESELELARTAPGVYESRGSNLSLDGRWTVTVILQQAADSFEIPLALETRCRAEAIPVAGGPTLYNIKTATGTVQGYVDPGTAGPNEVHVTFFTPAGGELPVTELPRIVGSHGSSTSMLDVRRFGPGHFVADADLEAGRWRFSFSGSIPGGGTAGGCFEEAIR